MALVLALCLGLAFRSVRGILLTLATVLVSGCALHLVMIWAGWSWNLMNLMALPLLLGAGVDYSIHIQLALHRHQGDVKRVRRTTGRALLLCAVTTATAFGSLGLSSNAGLASLGQVCASGLICSFLTAVYLLPAWWRGIGYWLFVTRTKRALGP
jgi:predicted RND superfamily exporter protein